MITFGLTEKQRKVLEYLQKKGKTSIYRIARELNLSYSGVYYILKKLKERGLLR